MEVYVDNRCWVDTEKLPPDVVANIKREFSHKNPVHYALKARGFWPGAKEPPTIETWKQTSDGLSIPRGGMQRLAKLLPGATFTGSKREPVTVDIPAFKLTLYDYQQRCVDAAVRGQMGLIKAPTGGGKTCTALGLFAELAVPTLVVVHSVALMKQWIERAKAAFGDDFEVGIIQGKKSELKPLTIGMAQTLHKYDKRGWDRLNGYFGCVIQDEVQFAAATTFMGVIDQCKMPYRIGLSADHTRKDRKEFLIHDLFGDVLESISRQDLINRAFVHDVEVIMEPTTFTADWYLIQRAANDLRLSGLDFDETYVELLKRWPDLKPSDVPAGQPDYMTLIDEMGQSNDRNDLILKLTERMVSEGHRTLVFTHRIDHCTRLAAEIEKLGIKTGILIGGPENKAEFQRTLTGLDTGEVMVGVGTWQALGTGIDCPRVSRGIMATPISGKQIWGQIRGRICRTAPGKTDAKFFYLWDKKVFFKSPVKNMKAWNTQCVVRDHGRYVEASEYLDR